MVGDLCSCVGMIFAKWTRSSIRGAKVMRKRPDIEISVCVPICEAQIPLPLTDSIWSRVVLCGGGPSNFVNCRHGTIMRYHIPSNGVSV